MFLLRLLFVFMFFSAVVVNQVTGKLYVSESESHEGSDEEIVARAYEPMALKTRRPIRYYKEAY